MKILYITTISNTMHRFLIPHIKELQKAGHQVDVGFKMVRQVGDLFLALGCEIYEFNFNRSPLKNNYIKLIKQVRTTIIEGGYEIVHTHTPIASAIVRIACKNLKNVRVIYTAHGFHFYDGAPLKNWLFFYPIEKLLAKYTDTLVTINEEDYDRAQTFESKNVKYVPGVGIDLNGLQVNKTEVIKLKKNLEFSSNDFILFSIGELNHNKNHNIVLKALSKINNKNIKYIVAGDGELKENLIQNVKELHLEKQVNFLGYRNDIYELLEISDVFIFPSYREGLSKSLMEAMALGKPVIASNIRGNSDLIDAEEGGYLFDPSNANELANLIDKILLNNQAREQMSEYNRKKVKDFSLPLVLKEMHKIYKS